MTKQIVLYNIHDIFIIILVSASLIDSKIDSGVIYWLSGLQIRSLLFL